MWLALLTLGTGSALAEPPPPAPSRVDLRIELQGIDASRGGQLACALWRDVPGWPSGEGAVTRVPASSGASPICRFDDVPAGTYAVSVLHDEDGDRQLDTNFVGVPQEGWGTSRNVQPMLRAPTFAESAIQVDAAHARFAITLHY